MTKTSLWQHCLTLGQRASRACLSVLYPPRCIACDRASQYAPAHTYPSLLLESFCIPCRRQVYQLDTSVHRCCRRCGHPIDHDAIRIHTPSPAQGPICFNCRKEPPAFRRASAAFVHAGSIRDALHRFKYRKDLAIGRQLAELFACLAPTLPLPWREYRWVTPVPLHPKRLRQRGFQQAWLLLRYLTLPDNATQHPALLTRRRATSSQAGLQRAERFANLRGAIEVEPRYRNLVQDQCILLIDDVMTTGATAEACADAMRIAGATAVDVLTLSRAVF